LVEFHYKHIIIIIIIIITINGV